MSDKPNHPLVPPRSEYFRTGCVGDTVLELPGFRSIHEYPTLLIDNEEGKSARAVIAAMACFEWEHSGVSQFKFEEYQPFLDFLEKSHQVDVMILDMSQRQNCGDAFVKMVCRQWASWAKGEPFE